MVFIGVAEACGSGGHVIRGSENTWKWRPQIHPYRCTFLSVVCGEIGILSAMMRTELIRKTPREKSASATSEEWRVHPKP